MRPYEIRGQNDTENMDCDITEFPVFERGGVQAEGFVQAIQTFLQENFQAAAEHPDEADNFFPRPANGSHWHYKVIDEIDRSDFREFSVAVQMIPMFRIAEMGDPEMHSPGGP